MLSPCVFEQPCEGFIPPARRQSKSRRAWRPAFYARSDAPKTDQSSGQAKLPVKDGDVAPRGIERQISAEGSMLSGISSVKSRAMGCRFSVRCSPSPSGSGAYSRNHGLGLSSSAAGRRFPSTIKQRMRMGSTCRSGMGRSAASAVRRRAAIGNRQCFRGSRRPCRMVCFAFMGLCLVAQAQRRTPRAAGTCRIVPAPSAPVPCTTPSALPFQTGDQPSGMTAPVH